MTFPTASPASGERPETVISVVIVDAIFAPIFVGAPPVNIPGRSVDEMDESFEILVWDRSDWM